MSNTLADSAGIRSNDPQRIQHGGNTMNTLLPMNNFLDAAFFGPGRSCAVNTSQTLRQAPRADILEGDTDFLVRLDLPGVSAEDLDINLEDQTLTVKAERDLAAPEGYEARRKEIPAKISYQRTFNIGKVVDAESISAKFENGVLVISLPKSAKSMPRRIEVN